MNKGIPFTQLIAELRQLCRERRTGMVFITTDDNQLAQLILENGNIVYLFFKTQRGENALRALRQYNTGSLRFAPGPIPTFRSELPPAEEVLESLQTADDQTLPEPIIDPTEEATAPPPSGRMELSERNKSILLEELTELIGPMAIIVCQEKLRSFHDLHTTIDVLGSALPDAAQATRFKNNVLHRIAH